MNLTTEEKRALANYKIEKADIVFTEATEVAKLEYWNLAANRLYYALFHAAAALMIIYGFSAKTHSGLISILGQKFVKEGILTKEDGILISRLQKMRQSGDYDDFFDWTKEDVMPMFDKTRLLLNKIKELIKP